MTVKVDTRGWDAKVRSLKRQEVPTAMRNTINDVARSVMQRQVVEMRKIFDRPTPFVLNGQRVREKATKQRWRAETWFKDYRSDALVNTVRPHIEGGAREHKGLESALISMGLMTSSQYLMPSRSMRLDRYGNVSGTVAAKMLRDLQATRGAGFHASRRTTRQQFVWGTVSSRSGVAVSGIWYASKFINRQPNALAMAVVNSAPNYRKRYRHYEVAQSHSNKVVPLIADKAIAHAIRRRHRNR